MIRLYLGKTLTFDMFKLLHAFQELGWYQKLCIFFEKLIVTAPSSNDTSHYYENQIGELKEVFLSSG